MHQETSRAQSQANASRHDRFTTFIVLGQQRTGSNLLVDLLNHHPGIVALGEIFSSPRRIQWDWEAAYRSGCRLPQPDEALVEERNSDPVGFVEKHVFSHELTSGVQAVGFKIFYEHCRNDQLRVVWEWLRKRPDISIIHLRRKNILRTLLSKRQAARKGIWKQRGAPEEQTVAPEEQPGASSESIRLKPTDCREFFERTLMHEREACYFFRHHRIFDVWYEDLAKDRDAVLMSLQAFLGVGFQRLDTGLIRQNTDSLGNLIENYGELKEKFRRLHTRKFFEE